MRLAENNDSWTEKFPLLSGLEDRQWRASLRETRAVLLNDGEQIFNEGEPCESFILLVSGIARIYKDAGSGRQITLYRVTPGQSCAMTTSCLLSRSSYPASGVAESNMKAILMPAESFRRCLVQSIGFRAFVFSNYGAQISSLVRLTTSLSFNRVEKRLLELLYDYSSQSSRLELTHQQIASELGTVREVVTRELNRLKQRGWLVVGRGYIEILDREQLGQQLLAKNH